MKEDMITSRESEAFYCLKCIAILSVITVHVLPYMDILDGGEIILQAWGTLSRIGVPSFLIVGGFFYKRRAHDTIQFWKKKWKQLVLPWLCCATITYIMSGRFNRVPSDQIVLDYVQWVSGYNSWYYYIVIHLFCLILFKFLYKKDVLLFATMCITLVSAILNTMEISVGFEIPFLSFYLNPVYRVGYFSLGILARKYRIDRIICRNRICVVGLFLAAVGMVLFVKDYNYNMNYVANSVIWCGLLLVISWWLTRTKIKGPMVFVGKASYCIYLLHMGFVQETAVRIPSGMFKIMFCPIIGLLVMVFLINVGLWISKKISHGEFLRTMVGLPEDIIAGSEKVVI